MDALRFETRFALASLATWRVSHLLAAEDGPLDTVANARQLLGGGALGRLMDCFYCLSVWVAAPVSLFVARRRQDAMVIWLALSGAACLIERVTGQSTDSLETHSNGAANVLWSKARLAERQQAQSAHASGG